MGDLSPNFSRREFACKCGCGLDSVDYETVMVMEDLREHFNQAVSIHSAHRCPAHNAAESGAENSEHLYARANDFSVAGVDPRDVQAYLYFKYSGKYGIGSYKSFTHLDTRTDGPARWEL